MYFFCRVWEIYQISERNAKGKLVFLFISERKYLRARHSSALRSPCTSLALQTRQQRWRQHLQRVNKSLTIKIFKALWQFRLRSTKTPTLRRRPTASTTVVPSITRPWASTASSSTWPLFTLKIDLTLNPQFKQRIVKADVLPIHIYQVFLD